MSAYDLRRLSSVDFEEIVHDLLEAEWKIKLEIFASGPDGGIDLRCVVLTDATIIQCKHYAGSGFTKLLSHLSREELSKVIKLQPSRYVLVTSVDLSPQNKDAIKQAMAPFIASVADIIGLSEIEALLRVHSEVERAHYKLWITSTAVLERILHSAERCQTDFQIERIKKKVPLFVQCDAHPQAMALLDKARIVVIAGPPGIGKTTLAEMLIFAHMEANYEPVVIEAEISEGRKLFRPERKQIFYFDDFLGQTYLGDRPEYFGRNQDSALASFTQMIQSSDHSRFILTTRQHILASAAQRSERLTESGLFNFKCIIEIGDYSRLHKARILYNHFYFSDLPEGHIRAALNGAFYLKIIDHPNFNPRIIEWLSTFSRLHDISAAQYPEYVLHLLNEPERIWTHAFNSQISNSARNILIALFTVAASDEIEDLEPTWRALHFHCSRKYNYSVNSGDFRHGLKELEGSFIALHNGVAKFTNPSVRDFIARYLSESTEILNDILCAATRFKQIEVVWNAGESAKFGALRGYFIANANLMLASLRGLLNSKVVRLAANGDRFVGVIIDSLETNKVIFALELSKHIRTDQSAELVTLALGAFVEEPGNSFPGIWSLLSILRRFAKATWLNVDIHRKFMPELLRLIASRFATANGDEWLELLKSEGSDSFWDANDRSRMRIEFENYRSHRADEEVLSCSDIGQAKELWSSLESIQREFNYDFSGELEHLDRRIESLTEEPEEDVSSEIKSTELALDGKSDDNFLKNMYATLATGARSAAEQIGSCNL
jgi:hypothetical protein